MLLSNFELRAGYNKIRELIFKSLGRQNCLVRRFGEILPDSEQIFPLEKDLRLLKINSLISECVS